MKLKYLIVPIFALAACGSLQAQTSDATPSSSPAHEGHWRHHDHWLWNKLNLTDAQKQQIHTIRENNRKNPTFRTALATYLQAKKKVQDDINATQAATSDDASALGAAEAQLAVVRTQQQNEIKAILSGDQVQTWNEFQAKRATRIQNRINKLTQPES
jgi:Spy/CpxP family protein refolding chaperone